MLKDTRTGCIALTGNDCPRAVGLLEEHSHIIASHSLAYQCQLICLRLYRLPCMLRNSMA
eukprot:2160847-Pyramimonas_sp.AAC.2